MFIIIIKFVNYLLLIYLLIYLLIWLLIMFSIYMNNNLKEDKESERDDEDVSAGSDNHSHRKQVWQCLYCLCMFTNECVFVCVCVSLF